jgi:WD40 repeat protein
MKSQKGQKKQVMNVLKKKRKRTNNKKQEENLSDNSKTRENENVLSKLKNIQFYKCIVEDAIDSGITDLEINLFEAFKSINNIQYLVYINKDNTIVFYDLNYNKKRFEIKNAHEESIENIRYILDKINKRDLLLTISYIGGNIKVWNIKSIECIFDIDSDSYTKCICSANFFYYDNQINIIAIYDKNRPYSEINVYNLNNDEIEEIKYFHGITYFLKTFIMKKIIIVI